MVKLTRVVRFSLTSDFTSQISGARAINSWGGWPGDLHPAPFLELAVTVSGDPDPRTGMLCNIKTIDDAVRTAGFGVLRKQGELDGAIILAELIDVLEQDFAERRKAAEKAVADDPDSQVATEPFACSLESLQLRLTPTLSLEMNAIERDRVLLTQQFEFAAAHRLNCGELSEEDNRRVFGKCNNIGGHGHNYILDVTLSTWPDDLQGRTISLERFEQVVRQEVIEPFDHEHLNCAKEFEGINPTVENIAKVIWFKLRGKFLPARLYRIRVQETAKTMAEYMGEPVPL